MFDIGFSELLLFGVIALIVLGPEKLPQAARTAGQWYAKIRRTVSTLQSEIEAELDLAETRQQMQKELAKIRQTEAEMRREMAEMRGSMQEFESSQNRALTVDPHAEHQPVIKDDTARNTVNEQPEAATAFAHAYERNEPSDGIDQQAAPPLMTKPWENMWFRLGDYDKARRLPAAPYLPNYQADILLNSTPANPIASQASAQMQEAD
ncbi:Sec-independent protein translocase protein TatB [Psychrobacter sp. CAM01]|uniref:Sec-independent protein translocase protein TatB n=1 Tax=Psychrobacter sp. CAM01 TaxID=3080335 RepID=UPI0029358CBB|nr:Sec-independent protein translocase protein TatB [Psychrobacter sp. CAM01]MDV2859362.1 Sec-independent protein translocase protein TatB [Psychrobacter sp. CAM01]